MEEETRRRKRSSLSLLKIGGDGVGYFSILFVFLIGILSANSNVKSEIIKYLEISENTPPGSRIGFIDADNPPYLIVPVPGSPVTTDLTVDPGTGEIRTKVQLDRETTPSYSLVALTQNIRIVIKILDENDNAPIFPVDNIIIEYPENSPRDSKRALPPAKDPDLGQYSTQKYEIINGNNDNLFKLSQHRGRDGVLYVDLQNSGQLDRELCSFYKLLIEANDGGIPSLRSQLNVTIIIQDVNDNPPVFNQTRYTASIAENATIGTSVLQVNASDADIGINGDIEYSINRRQSDRDEMFKINTKTGMIYVNKQLDFETKENHELVIVARDLGIQPLETSVFLTVYVQDVNDNQPMINVIFLTDDATPKISESAQPGEFIARISISDPDSRNEYSNATVTLNGGDGNFGLATRDNIIYLVVVERKLDREYKSIYNLSVEATDTGTPPLRAIRTFKLIITDVNDNSPIFNEQQYVGHIYETSEPGTEVTRVKATDLDDDNNSIIKYSLKNTTSSESFNIDENSGIITTNSHINCDNDPTPILVVVASDMGKPSLSSSAIVKITIYDLNDNEPIFDKPLYNVTVAEDLPIGHCFLKVHATDPDCGVNSIVNYTLAQSTGKLSNEQLLVRSDTGEICVKSSLDYELSAYLELSVVATDRGGLSSIAIVRIHITDVNDNHPIFNPLIYNTTINIDDTSLQNEIILKLIATDNDDNSFGKVSYRITSGNDNGIFKIDNDGQLQIARNNYQNYFLKSTIYQLNITAVDGHGLKSNYDATAYITVSKKLKINNGQYSIPLCQKSRYNIPVKENILQNSIIGNVKEKLSTESSLFGKQNSRFFLATGDNEFSIDSNTGIIRTKITFDRELIDHYILSIGLKNDYGIGYCQVEISIEDVNDNLPLFKNSKVRISIPESQALDTPIYVAHATDPDITPSVPIRYIVGQESSNDLFGIDAHHGDIYLLRKLDYETQQRHMLFISAIDGGGLTSNQTITIEVQDVNDNPPVFERNEYSVDLSEGTKINSLILQVTALDLDTGNNARISYRLHGSLYFRINSNNGSIYLTKSLDRETMNYYKLTIYASDNGSPAATATTIVNINIIDENDNSPIFDKEYYTFDLQENLPSGTIIGCVSANDNDIGKNSLLKYTIVQQNSSFIIDSDTGIIKTRESLDREEKNIHDIILEAKDQGIPSKTTRVNLRINVLDVNDNSPDIIDPQGNIVSVREEQPIGTEVARVRAIDNDYGENGTITYSILKDRDSNGWNVFTIDSITGIIRTKLILDHEEHNVYRVSVQASDNGNPIKTSVRAFRVEVLGLADNRPTFTSTSLTFHVNEDAYIGKSIGLLSDTGSIGHVSYTLDLLTPKKSPLVTSNEQYPAFDVDTSTGQLVVAHTLDREYINEYQLKIRALDTTSIGNPQSIAVSVKIIIDDVNDNYPIWQNDPIIIYVNENTLIGTIIYNSTAIDIDSGENGELRYELINELPSNDSFMIDSLTGALIVIKTIDREDIDEYTLILRAYDCPLMSNKRLSSTVTVKIIVIDENDNNPYFVTTQNNKISLNEGTLPGTDIFRVIALDNDAGDNGRVTYVITSGNDDSKLSIDYDSGLITLIKPIISDTIIEVTASDHGIPARHTKIKLTITIINGQINGPPRLLINNPIVKVSEYLTIGGSIANVAAGVINDHVNVSFHVSPAYTDKFTISSNGLVTLVAPLDREKISYYDVPIIAKSSKLHDQTILKIQVDDENDNSPQFHPGSCYTLVVPENQDSAVIHAITAFDIDDGKNGDISYNIVGGNIGRKFKLDSKSGELSSSNLDRESQSTYVLSISAKDNGRPSLEARCNITIRVIDVNDNSPMFTESSQHNPSTNDYPSFTSHYDNFNYMSGKYTATISENLPTDSSVMTIRAVDPDQGVNGKITYSIFNEINWHFRIDNLTGVITTAGPLDRERQETYNFLVIATDGGLYNVKNSTIPVEINLTDVNDNSPIFIDTPLRKIISPSTQPGHSIMTIKAYDSDIGNNGEIIYSLSSSNDNEQSKFRINPNTGVLTTTNSLTQDYDKIYNIEIIARDKGNPSLSKSNFIELIITDNDNYLKMLKFQNDTYNIIVQENSPIGMEIIKVNAVRSDGRRQKILYSICSGNDYDTFIIDEETGTVKINDPTKLDAEIENNYIDNENILNDNLLQDNNQELINNINVLKNEKTKRVLTLVAKTTGTEPLMAYAKLIIYISDVNDNPPIFTQTQYSATIAEANDADQGINSKILYHIVDGNPDNAFTISPPYSGIVRTNIVLDREIRDKYRLTIIATDQGNPQLTGTAALSIRVIDVNDNQPTFPVHNVISVSEGTTVGSVLTTITANDVDSSPALIYTIGNVNDFGPFSIDRYGGKVTLTGPLDAEKQNEYTLKIIASDSIHQVTTDLIIRVNDVNDNIPRFNQAIYMATLADGWSENIGSGSVADLQEVIIVNATDNDILEENNKINYHLQYSVKGFTIDSLTGAIMVNRTALVRPLPKEIELIIIAKDTGKVSLHSTCLVIVRLNQLEYSSLTSKEFKININENIKRGTTIIKLNDIGLLDGTIISNGNNNNDTFEIFQDNLIVIKNLDREKKDKYLIQLGSKNDKSSMLNDGILITEDNVIVTIIINDINDNYPIFSDDINELSIKEDTPIDSLLIKINATDNDCPDTLASKITYNITSGNDAGLFKIDKTNGELRINSTLDCDLMPDSYSIVITACDNDKKIQLCTMKKLNIHIDDVNDNSPKFPVIEYVEFVGENEPIGTRVVSARAYDIDRGVFGNLNYTILSASDPTMIVNDFAVTDDSWKLFKIDKNNGLITTNVIFDYEQRNRYAFLIRATDYGGKYTQINVKIEIDSRDEFYPQFTERMYRFLLSDGVQTKIGTIIGYVRATDRDKGPDGRVVYQLSSQHTYLKLNRTTGALIIKKKLNYDIIEDCSRLIVSASSGRQGSLSNMTVVEVRLVESNSNDIYDANSLSASDNYKKNMTIETSSSFANWTVGLLLSLLLIILVMCGIYYVYLNNRKYNKSNSNNNNHHHHNHNNKSSLTGDCNNQTSSNSYVDPSAFDTIPIRNINSNNNNNNNNSNINNNSNNNNNIINSNCLLPSSSVTTSNGCSTNTFTTNLPPKYDEIPAYSTSRSSTNGGVSSRRHEQQQQQRRHHHPTSDLSESEQSGSSGRGSAEDDGDDEEIRMINEGGQTTGDSSSDLSVNNTQEYLARLGIVDNISSSVCTPRRPQEALPIDNIHLFDDVNDVGDADITTLIYGKINCDNNNTHLTSEIDSIGQGGPSMNGSLSSIVHSEEELAGSYNWDYLLDWGPQYQPLAHVFGEIARLKDDNASIKSGVSNNSTRLKKSLHNKPPPPPLLTSVAPRLLAAPALARGILPRSPISHDTSLYPSAALSPSFSPSLSPLATKVSPSISPLVPPTPTQRIHTSGRLPTAVVVNSDNQIRI
ncbi:hypothetical protein HCN44_008793 [Aphidius gifuensis]|uniref:Protocadherin-16 n=1 Tax=Aphidius gifuensis TaxID=684658 RepID=A0A834XRI5_APHGI|nr:hypothetical protein HCN44_008793 [Aphidius gifuensis]